MGDVTHVSSESINAHKELKIFGNENLEIDKFNEASDANRIQNLKLESTNSIASPLIQLIISLLIVLQILEIVEDKFAELVDIVINHFYST